jgi:hypothetical protein
MRIHSIVSLVVALAVASCDDAAGPSGHGVLVVSTSTGGTDPDREGYLLTVDDTGSVALSPTDTAEMDLPSGRHRLRLLGVADHCVVAPGASLEVDVMPERTTTVAFAVSCQTTGARITVVTTGADLDRDGYRVVVDGTDRGAVPANGSVLTRLGSGPRTIQLQGLAPNCSVDGEGSQAVTIQESEVVRIEFVVVCAATTGTIAVHLSAGAADGEYAVRLDGGAPILIVPDLPAFVPGVAPGEHVVSLDAPAYCTVENPSRSVTVTAGSPVRDTAKVVFSVSCRPTGFRISAPTTGPTPSDAYSVFICDSGWYCYYNEPSFVGNLAPNGTLLVPVDGAPGLGYSLELRDVPANCRVQVPNPTAFIIATDGETLDVEFPVACSP